MFFVLKLKAREESHEVFPAPEVKTEITVIVTDVNDEVPTFRSARYVAEINENAQVNTAVSFIGPVIPQVFDYDQVSVPLQLFSIPVDKYYLKNRLVFKFIELY